jgi:hypothetical protein
VEVVAPGLRLVERGELRSPGLRVAISSSFASHRSPSGSSDGSALIFSVSASSLLLDAVRADREFFGARRR